MTLQWMQQKSTGHERCARCQGKIPGMDLYHRATFDPDGVDEFGYDVCDHCRRLLPLNGPPPAKESLNS